jgi:hypothetical protein
LVPFIAGVPAGGADFVEFEDLAGIGMGVAIVTRPSDDSPAKPRDRSSHLVIREVSHCLGHEEVVFLQGKGRDELQHVKAFQKMVVETLFEAV